MPRRHIPLFLFLGTQLASAAQLDLYISAPDVQTTFITSGATTVTFNSLSTGNRTTDYSSAIGTYDLSGSRPFNIQAANQFGGANGSRYMAFGAQSGSSGPIPLQLSTPRTYFGFWLSAVDQYAGISFYSGSIFLGRFSSSVLATALSPVAGTVTSINGTVYNNSDYYGNPNNNQNTGEIYTYVHVVAQGTATFDRLVFDNSGTIATGFETDNHTVYTGNLVIPGTEVLIGTMTDAAEPGTMGCALIAFSLLLGARGRWKRRRSLILSDAAQLDTSDK
jgi:hypothetical protein